MLAGSGSLPQGLPEGLRRETQIAVQLAESPLTCVAVGSGMYLDEIDTIAHRRKPKVAVRPLTHAKVRDAHRWRSTA